MASQYAHWFGFRNEEERLVFNAAIRFAVEEGYKHPSVYAESAVKALRRRLEDQQRS